MELHAEEKVSPLSGCLPSLLQLPAFFLLYHLFSSRHDRRRAQRAARPTSSSPPRSATAGRTRSATAGCSAAQGLVYLGLFAIVAGVATFNYRRTKRMMAANAGIAGRADERAAGAAGMGAIDEVHAADVLLHAVHRGVVPLAAALYVVTSTTWSAVERAVPATGDVPVRGGAAVASAVSRAWRERARSSP